MCAVKENPMRTYFIFDRKNILFTAIWSKKQTKSFMLYYQGYYLFAISHYKMAVTNKY